MQVAREASQRKDKEKAVRKQQEKSKTSNRQILSSLDQKHNRTNYHCWPFVFHESAKAALLKAPLPPSHIRCVNLTPFLQTRAIIFRYLFLGFYHFRSCVALTSTSSLPSLLVTKHEKALQPFTLILDAHATFKTSFSFFGFFFYKTRPKRPKRPSARAPVL